MAARRRLSVAGLAIYAIGLLVLPGRGSAQPSRDTSPKRGRCEYLLAGVGWIQLRELAAQLKELQPIPGLVDVTGGLRLAQAKDALLGDPLFPLTRSEIDKLSTFGVREALRSLIENRATYWAVTGAASLTPEKRAAVVAKVRAMSSDAKAGELAGFLARERASSSAGQDTKAIAAAAHAGLPSALDTHELLLMAQVKDFIAAGPRPSGGPTNVDRLTPLGLTKELERCGCAPSR